jgi:hypothetical protein
VRAGAERLAWIDDDCERVLVGLEPRRADPERADPNRPMEFAPGVLPAGLDGLAGRVGELGANAFLPRPVRVGGELERVALGLLEPGRAELDEARPSLLPALGRNADGYPAQALGQRNAARSFSRKLPSRR